MIKLLLLNGARPDYYEFFQAAVDKKWQACLAFCENDTHKNDDEERDEAYGQVLLEAAKYGQVALINSLLEKNACFTESFSMGKYAGYGAFHFVVRHGEKQLAEKFLKQRVSPEQRFNGPAPLQLALDFDQAEMVELLLLNGAKPDEEVYEALKAAADQGRWESVTAFVKYNPHDVKNKKCSDAYEEVLLDAECHRKIELVGQLLDKNAPVGCSYSEGDYENWDVFYFAIARGEKTLIERLVNQRIVNLNVKFDDELTPLQVAFKHNQAEIVGLLLSNAAKPDYAGLKQAVNEGKMECVYAFIRNNPFNPQDPDCFNHYYDMYLNAHADKNAEMIEALNTAGMKKDEDVYKFLISKEFASLEGYLQDTRAYDAAPQSWYWTEIKKEDVLSKFINRLKVCSNMEEIRGEFEKLKTPDKEGKSDYEHLNTARGGVYRFFGFFGMDTTTVTRINKLNALIPPVDEKKPGIENK